MTLDLTFIGSGNAFVREGACWNGFVANGRVLFEAPPQTLMSLNRLKIDPDAIESVVLSHHHGDHFLGLPFLLLHWKHLGRTKPVTIIGPPETEAVAHQVCERVYPSIFEETVAITWITAEAGRTIRSGSLEIEPIPVLHDPKLTANFGYLARMDGHTFGYTGDSALCDGVLDLARRAEVLVSECSSRDERHPTHMNLVDDMPLLRSALPAGAPLVLTHLPHDLGDVSLPSTAIARDFETMRF